VLQNRDAPSLLLVAHVAGAKFDRDYKVLGFRPLIESNQMAGTSQLIQIELGPPVRVPKPDWLRAKAPVGDNFHELKKLARGLGLHTVCESAQCPNIGECWNHKTATFMLLGDICTRRCGFCAVPKGRPEPIDWDEPRRVAEAVATLGLKHAVVTSVNRDDDNVGGAKVFAETIREIRELIPDCRIEVLIPDFQGSGRTAEDCARREA
jgi:lipoyl synthase